MEGGAVGGGGRVAVPVPPLMYDRAIFGRRSADLMPASGTVTATSRQQWQLSTTDLLAAEAMAPLAEQAPPAARAGEGKTYCTLDAGLWPLESERNSGSEALAGREVDGSRPYQTGIDLLVEHMAGGGRPARTRLRKSPFKPHELGLCPDCHQTMAVNGATGDFRRRCRHCGYVWVPLSTDSGTTAEALRAAEGAEQWVSMLWARIIQSDGRDWLLIVNADSPVGVVDLGFALAVRQLIAEGPALLRSELAVVWAVVHCVHQHIHRLDTIESAVWRVEVAQDDTCTFQHEAPVKWRRGQSGATMPETVRGDGSGDAEEQSLCELVVEGLSLDADDEVACAPPTTGRRGHNQGTLAAGPVTTDLMHRSEPLLGCQDGVSPGPETSAGQGHPWEASRRTESTETAEEHEDVFRWNTVASGSVAGERRGGHQWRRPRSRRDREYEQLELGRELLTMVRSVPQVVAEWGLGGILLLRDRVALKAGEVNPWPKRDSYPSGFWDRTVESCHLERTSNEQQWSPHVPVTSQGAQVVPQCTLNHEAVWQALAGHPQRAWFAAGGLWGFPLMSTLAPQHVVYRQLPLTRAEDDSVEAWMTEQLTLGRSVAVTSGEHVPTALITTPFVVVKKGDGKPRVCQHFSAGGRESVNASMVMTAVEPVELLQLGDVVTRARYLRAKHPQERIVAFRVDLKSYFHQIPLRTRDAWITAQKHRGRTIVHRFCTFGGASTPATASAISNIVCDVVGEDLRRAQCSAFVRVFLDDFVGVCRAVDADRAVACLREWLVRFGLVENTAKFCPPMECMDVLGTRVDFAVSRAWLTPARVESLGATLNEVLAAHRVQGVTLQHLCGVLTFVGTVIPFSRAHVSPLWSAIAGLSSLHQHIPMSGEVRWACQWWKQVIAGDRLQRIAPFDIGTSPAKPLGLLLGVRSDASTSWGFGAVSVGHRWFMQGRWLEWHRYLTIGALEALAALVVVHALGEQGVLSGRLVYMQADSSVLVFGMLKEHSRDQALVATCRLICALQEFYRCKLVFGHISTHFMDEPDKLSRGQHPSVCLSEPESWIELSISEPVQAALWIESVQLPRDQSLARRAAAQALITTTSTWKRSVTALGGWSGLTAEVSIPFVPCRQWTVQLNEGVHA